MLNKWGPFLLSLCLGIWLAFIAILPPTPKSIDAPQDQFSAARAMEDIRIIAAKPHPTGSEENAKVRAYLLTRLKALGFETSTNAGELPERPLARLNRWSGEDAASQSFVNVIGVKAGTDRTKPAVLLMAHHDTVWGSPGAADDTIGIASIFEIIRALNSAGPTQRDIIVLFTDAEELGLVGARQFFAWNPLRSSVGVIINFEARGGGGTANMFQTSAKNGNTARLYAKSVKQPSTSSLSTFVYSILPNDTDLTPALKGDYVAYNIANIGRAEQYHSPKNETDALQVSTLQHMGSQGLDLTRALVSADSFPTPKKDATFFDAFGLFTVIYAPAFGWVFVLFTLVSLGLSYDKRGSHTDILTGALRMGGFLIFGGGLLFILNLLSGAGRGADYYDRLAAISELQLMAGFAGLAVLLLFFGRKALSENGLIGAALPWLGLGIIGQALAPTASYFIVLAVLLFALTTAVQRKLKTRWAPTLLPALIIGYMLGLFHLLMVGVGPDLPSVAILPFALLTLAILPLYPGTQSRAGNKLAFISLGLSVAAALWIRLDPVASTVPLY